MKISLNNFGGVAPRIPPRYLQESQAQIARNCDLRNLSLKPLAGLGATGFTLTKSGTPKTIYRFGQDEPATTRATQYWFSWSTDVDVVRSQIAGDVSEWTFFTGDGVPKATYNSIAIGSSTNYPDISYGLGIDPPVGALTPTVSSETPPVDDIPTTRVYTYTWVGTVGGRTMESAPQSTGTTAVDVYSSQTVTLTNFDTIPSASPWLTHRRIYRSIDGGYFYVGEITVAATSFEDTTAADAVGEPLPSLDWNPPPDDMAGLVNLPNGPVAGFSGRDIFLSEPYIPHAFPDAYQQSVDYPVVGFGVIDTTLCVLTKGTPYFLQGSHPDSMVLVKSDFRQACVSKRSIVSMDGAVIYASPDGLVLMTPSGSKLLSQDIMSRDQWQALKPETIHAYGHDQKYIAFYDDGTTQASFIYDFTTGQLTTSTDYATAGFTDLVDDVLYLAKSNKTMHTFGSGATGTYLWRSKIFTMPHHTSFSCAEVDAEAYPVTARYYADGALLHTQVVTSRLPFRLPAKPALDWEIELEGSVEVFATAIAQSMEELSSV